MRIFKSVDDLTDAIGQEMGPTPSLTVDQQRIDLFAEATGDHQWIHVDAQRAAAGPFGSPVAHGYLTLSLIPQFAAQLFVLDLGSARLNYGVNKARFPNVVKVDSRLNAVAQIVSVTPREAGHALTIRYSITIDGQTKPACVAETISVLMA